MATQPKPTPKAKTQPKPKPKAKTQPKPKANAKTQAETEQAADRIRALNEQILDFGRRAGTGFLEAYEQNLQTFADYQDKVADQTKVDWIVNLARAQANFTREITRVYTTTARDLLKK